MTTPFQKLAEIAGAIKQLAERLAQVDQEARAPHERTNLKIALALALKEALYLLEKDGGR